MEPKVIRWMNGEEAERLLQAMKAPVKREDQPAAKSAVVVLEGRPAREMRPGEEYKVASL